MIQKLCIKCDAHYDQRSFARHQANCNGKPGPGAIDDTAGDSSNNSSSNGKNVCSICQRMFTTPQGLSSHVAVCKRKKAAEEKKERERQKSACQWCGKLFNCTRSKARHAAVCEFVGLTAELVLPQGDTWRVAAKVAIIEAEANASALRRVCAYAQQLFDNLIGDKENILLPFPRKRELRRLKEDVRSLDDVDMFCEVDHSSIVEMVCST